MGSAICGPGPCVRRILHFRCQGCRRLRFILVRDYRDAADPRLPSYYDATYLCTGCGREWSGGELLQPWRKPAARMRYLARAKALWRAETALEKT